MSHSKFFTGKLYQRMSDDLHLAGMSERTHEGYLRAVRQLADYCQTPRTFTEARTMLMRRIRGQQACAVNNGQDLHTIRTHSIDDSVRTVTRPYSGAISPDCGALKSCRVRMVIRSTILTAYRSESRAMYS